MHYNRHINVYSVVSGIAVAGSGWWRHYIGGRGKGGKPQGWGKAPPPRQALTWLALKEVLETSLF